MAEEAKGKNPNRVIDNLDDLDREFCETLDKLVRLHRRIMIRAHETESEKEDKTRSYIPFP